MKEMESGNFIYTQKDVIIGNKMRSVIIIDKKPGADLGKIKTANTSQKSVSVRKKKCSGCSRNKRG